MAETIPGLGDPYWYEWFVGLGHILDMLADDRISSVTFQSEIALGLDDVVVARDDGVDRIQVKHSRVGDTLSFGDLVEVGDGKSLLSSLAEGWKSATEAGERCRAILYTNREASSRRAATRGADAHQRPALDTFWAQLITELAPASSLDEVNVAERDQPAWGELRAQLTPLSTEADKLAFLRSLDLKTDQPSLSQLDSQILRRLAALFGCSDHQAEALRNALYSGLRKWTTSLRGKRPAVTREDVFSALSAPAESVGEHQLPPPAPFFASRQGFLSSLADALSTRERPVIFLSGTAGSGKTSLVSQLANAFKPVVQLRFHAFRPVSPDSPVRIERASRTALAETLWSDLLSQIRDIFRRRSALAKHSVPVRDFAMNWEQKRSHVMRLSQILAQETGDVTGIAIDGIDHAARAGISEITLLDALVAPEDVPAGVCLLVAGQPGWPQYPSWLRVRNDKVLSREVPSVSQSDVELLLSHVAPGFPRDDREAAVRAITGTAGGSTLVAVYAAHECAGMTSLAGLLDRLEQRRLRDGISAYYESLWSAATRALEDRHIGAARMLAACVALAPSRITAPMLAKVFSDLPIATAQWAALLSDLKPVLVSDVGGYRPLHNDLRVHLFAAIREHPQVVPEIAGRLVDFYLGAAGALQERQFGVPQLLQLADRESEWRTLFTTEYALEGLRIEKPPERLVSEAQIGLKYALDRNDWDAIHRIACALLTVKQWDASGATRSAPLAVPEAVVPSERFVLPREAWTLNVWMNVVRDAKRLIDAEQSARAHALLRRWFGAASVEELARGLPSDEVGQGRSGEPTRPTDEARQLFRQLGSATVAVGLPAPEIGSTEDGLVRELVASFASARFMEAAERLSGRSYVRELRRPLYWDDVVKSLRRVAERGEWRTVGLALRSLDVSAPTYFHAQLAVLAVLSGDARAVQEWAQPLVGMPLMRFSEVPRASYDTTVPFACRAFVRCALDRIVTPAAVGEETAEALRNGRTDDRRRVSELRLVRCSALVGRWFATLKSPDLIPRAADVSDAIEALLDPGVPSPAFIPYDFYSIASWLVPVMLYCGGHSGGPYAEVLHARALRYAAEGRTRGPAEAIWGFLASRGEHDALRAWATKWVGRTGKAWALSIDERRDLAEMFIQLLRKLGGGGDILADEAEHRLKWSRVGYAGHKDYSLGVPLAWFTELSRVDSSCWREHGASLLAQSLFASRAGDNRESTYVEAAIAAAAAKAGPGSLASVLKARRDAIEIWDEEDARTVVVDGVVGALESGAFTERELQAVWSILVGVTSWYFDHDRALLQHGRDALRACAERLGKKRAVEVFLGGDDIEAASGAGEDRYRIGNRWYTDQRTDRDAETQSWSAEVAAACVAGADEAIGVVLRIAESRARSSSAVWTLVEEAVRGLARSRPSLLPYAARRLADALRYRTASWPWHFDGAIRAVESLVPYLDDDALRAIASLVSGADARGNPLGWADSVGQNLDTLSLLRAKVRDRETIQRGCERLLAMHRTWVNGHGALPDAPAVEWREVELPSRDWVGFAEWILCDRLGSAGATVVQSAMRGLSVLLRYADHDGLILESLWADSRERTLYWRLLLAESAASRNATGFDRIRSKVEEVLAGEGSPHALQAWVVLGAHSRATGAPAPEMTELPRQAPASGSGPAQVLVTEARTEGRLRLIDHHAAVLSLLSRLEAVAGRRLSTLRAEIERLPVARVPAGELARRGVRDNDTDISQTHDLDRVRAKAAAFIRQGGMRGIPLVAVCQALLESDDPSLLGSSPAVLDAVDGWLVDDALDKHRSAAHAADELVAPFEAVLTAGLGRGEVVLGAHITTYSRAAEVELVWRRYFKTVPVLGEPAAGGSAPSGRGFAFYHQDRYEPRLEQTERWILLVAGGMHHFIDRSFHLIPPVFWNSEWGWAPSQSDPTRWLRDGVEVARFEWRAGPIRSLIQERYYRQPLMQRWVCTRDAWESLQTRCPGMYSGAWHAEVR